MQKTVTIKILNKMYKLAVGMFIFFKSSAEINEYIYNIDKKNENGETKTKEDYLIRFGWKPPVFNIIYIYI